MNTQSDQAAQFLQIAAEEPNVSQAFILGALQHFLERAGTRTGAFHAQTNAKIKTSGDGPHVKIELLTSAASTTLVAEIVAAADHGLRVEPRYVVSPTLLQARIMVFIDSRIVGQLFCSRDGRRLRLDVRELPKAADIGNGVVVIEKVPFNVHTPLGSVYPKGH